jgi:pyruvate/2-oxoglutarate dehydrogenase complex dihydrolipoamide dehydrogenase (E3) component
VGFHITSSYVLTSRLHGFRVGSLGGRVCLVESHFMGGDCTNFGCVPSKALIKSAHVAKTCRG